MRHNDDALSKKPEGAMKRRAFLGLLGAAAVVRPKLAFAARDFPTRAALAAALAGGLVPEVGQTYTAGGFRYAGASGAAALPDLPGLLPDGDVYPQHFGALADLAYTLRNDLPLDASSAERRRGFVRTGGTNDRAAFEAADAHAFARRVQLMLDGDYFIDGEIRPKARWIAKQRFASTLWCRHSWNGVANQYIESGMVLLEPGSGLIGIRFIDQWAATSVKPNKGRGMGCFGTAVRVGEFGTVAEQPLRKNIDLDVLFCRAARLAGEQPSQANLMVTYMGHVEDCRVGVGVFGATNVGTNILLLCHFGFTYDPRADGFDDRNNPSKTDARMLETYHPSNFDITFLSELDNADGWGLLRPYDLASTGAMRVGPVRTRGLPTGGAVSCGDYCDMLTVERQKGTIGKGIRLGFIHATGCRLSNRNDEARFGGFYVKGIGTVSGSGFVYDGTDMKLRSQLEWDIKCEGMHLEMEADAAEGKSYPPMKPSAVRGVWLNGCLGSIDLGKISTFGATRAVEVEYSNCDLVYDYVAGDGVLMYEFSKGGRILGSSTTRRGDDAEDGSQASARKTAVTVIGRTLATKTTQDIPAGATIIPIKAFDAGPEGRADDVYVGDPISIGDETVIARALIQNGVSYLVTTPLGAPVRSGTPVVIDQRARLDRFVGSFDSGGEGIVLVNANVLDADLSRVKWAGRHAASLKKGSYLQLVEGPPAPLGRSAGAGKAIAFDRTSRVDGPGAR
jgi:hypothetical protein